MTAKAIIRTDASVLRPSGNSKTRAWKGQKNTFGLLPGTSGSCPGATTGLGGCLSPKPGLKTPTCYVHRVMSFRPPVKGVLEHNSNLVQSADPVQVRRVLRTEFQRFYEREVRRPEPSLFYRLHWSGDVFDRPYAKALYDVMGEFPELGFWNYTRSFWAVPLLSRRKNLVQYISLDPINFELGLRAYRSWQTRHNRYDNVQICYMSPERDFEERAARLADRLRKSAFKAWLTDLPEATTLKACPVDAGKLELEGGCHRCGKCTGHRGKPKPIWFKS